MTAAGAGDVDEVVYVVITPDGELLELRADGRPDQADPEDPYQSALWTAVREAVAPNIEVDPDEPVTIDGLPLPEQSMRIKFVNPGNASRYPDLLRPNAFGGAVAHILGLRMKEDVCGRVAIVSEEDAESALTPSLSEQQLDAIRDAHKKTVGGGGAGEAALWRFD